MIALLIGYESVSRIFAPVPIHLAEALPIACLGLMVNIASAWLLSSGGEHHHGHSHGHSHGYEEQHDHDEAHWLAMRTGMVVLEVSEGGVPPRFRLHAETGPALGARQSAIETVRPDGSRQIFALVDRGIYLESADEIPEPHAFTAHLRIADDEQSTAFAEHAHASTGRDNNMRAALVHVIADAAVSLLVIAGLLLARACGWLWMDHLRVSSGPA
jgi:Co/Zn/Cd efflux system component